MSNLFTPADARIMADAIAQAMSRYSSPKPQSEIGKRNTSEDKAAEIQRQAADIMLENAGSVAGIYASLVKTIDESNKAFGDLSKATGSLAEGTEDLAKLGTVLEQAERKRLLNLTALTLSLKTQEEMGETVYESMREYSGSASNLAAEISKSAIVMRSFASDAARSSVGFAALSASNFESAEQTGKLAKHTGVYAAVVKKATVGLSDVDTGVLDAGGALDKFTGQLRDNLDLKDIAKIRIQLGQVQAIIQEHSGAIAASRAAYDAAPEGASKTSATMNLINSLGAKAMQLRTAGANLNTTYDITEKDESGNIVKIGEGSTIDAETGQLSEDFKEALAQSPEALNDFIEHLKKFGEPIDKVIETIDKQSEILAGEFGEMAAMLDNKTVAMKDKLNGFIDGLTVSGTLAKLGHAAKKVADEIVDFNAAMVPATYWEVNKQAVKMGMSFAETTKYLQANKHAMAMMGSGFGDYQSKLKDSAEKFGMTFEQASDIITESNNNAALAGVDNRNQDAMVKYQEEQMSAYQRLASISNITAAEFARLNTELYSAVEIQGVMIGMTDEQQESTRVALNAERERYVAMGLSNEQAQEMLLSQRRAAREGVVARMGAAAKEMVLAKQVGMSDADAQRLFALKNKRNLTSEENEELTRLRVDLAAKGETFATRGAAQETTYNALGGSLQSELPALLKMKATQEANAGKSEEEIAAQTEAGKGKESVAEAGNLMNSIAAITNSALGGLTIAAIAAGLALGKMAIAARMNGGGGILDSLGGRGRGRGRGRPRRPGLNPNGPKTGRSAEQKAAHRAANPGRTDAALARQSQIASASKVNTIKNVAPKVGGVIGAVVGTGLAVATVADLKSQYDAGEITKKDAIVSGTEAVGGAAGGAAGAWAGGAMGAKAGAAIGALFGGVGAVPGALIGGLIGSTAGYFAGDALGAGLSGAAANAIVDDETESTPTESTDVEKISNITPPSHISETLASSLLAGKHVSGVTPDTKTMLSNTQLSGFGNFGPPPSTEGLLGAASQNTGGLMGKISGMMPDSLLGKAALAGPMGMLAAAPMAIGASLTGLFGDKSVDKPVMGEATDTINKVNDVGTAVADAQTHVLLTSIESKLVEIIASMASEKPAPDSSLRNLSRSGPSSSISNVKSYLFGT